MKEKGITTEIMIPKIFETLIKTERPDARINQISTFNNCFTIDMPRNIYLHGSSAFIRQINDAFEIETDIVVTGEEIGEKVKQEFEKIGLKFIEFHHHDLLMKEVHIHLEGKLTLTKFINFLKLFRYF
jgi:hypothetical protein